jgi:hypothetical protein
MAKHDIHKQVADEIMGLFRSQDEYLLLMGDNSVHGCEYVSGLRLAGNCLYDAVVGDHPRAETRLASTAPGRPEGSAMARLPPIQAGIEKQKKIKKVSFVICYHLYGTAVWELDWSTGQTRDDAIAEVFLFVQTAMITTP